MLYKTRRLYEKGVLVLNLKIYLIISIYSGRQFPKISLNRIIVNTVVCESYIYWNFSITYHGICENKLFSPCASVCDVNMWKYLQAWFLGEHEIRTLKQTKLVAFGNDLKSRCNFFAKLAAWQSKWVNLPLVFPSYILSLAWLCLYMQECICLSVNSFTGISRLTSVDNH